MSVGLVTLVALGVVPPASADIEKYAAYPGNAFGRGLVNLTPTAAKPQNKLWWHDGRWWALMYVPSEGSVRVASLGADHTWALTGPVVSRQTVGVGDAVENGNDVHVLSRTTSGITVQTLTFDDDTGRYRRVGGTAAVVTPRGTSSAAMTLDSLGRLWITYVTDRVRVVHSSESRKSWTAPYDLPVPRPTIGEGEISDIVAYDDRVGVMWSDQRRGLVRFAVHRNDAPDTAWTSEVALSGAGMADDHISMQVVRHRGQDTPFAAVKTSMGDNGEAGDSPLVLVLRRTAGGWSNHVVSTVDDGWTRPVLAIDAAGTAYVIGRRAGSIVVKSAPVDSLKFDPGPGTVVMNIQSASLTDPTVASQLVDPVCGILVLASDERSRRYWHGEIALDGPAATYGSACSGGARALAAPRSVTATESAGAVRLTWSDGGTRWSPADSDTARSFSVLRDGIHVGSTSETTFVDDPPAGSRPSYQILAVNRAGARSEPSAPAPVSVPATGSLQARAGRLALWVAAAAGAVLLILYGAYGLGRSRVHRRADRARFRPVDPGLALPLHPASARRHSRVATHGNQPDTPSAAHRNTGRHRR